MEHILQFLGLVTLQGTSSSTPLLHEKDGNEEPDNDIYRKPRKRALTASEVDEPPEPAWRVNRQRNYRSSPLHRLPEEILRMIFNKSDLVAQQMIRQACHRFAGVVTHLDAKRIVNRAGERFDDCFDLRQIWICHGSTVNRYSIRAAWATLTRRDRGIRMRAMVQAGNQNTDNNTNFAFCKSCRWFEASGQLNEQLTRLKMPRYCYGCETCHPRGWFPATDRKDPWFWGHPDNYPRCVRWRGKVRLCEHVQVSWKDYSDTMGRKRKAGIAGVALPELSCPKGCHWRGCTNSLPLRADDFGSKGAWNDRPMLSPTFGAVAREKRQAENEDEDALLLTWASRVFDIEPEEETKDRNTGTKSETQGGRENEILSLKTNKPFRDFLRTVDTSTGPSLCPHMTINDGQLLRPLQAPFCQCFTDDRTKDNGYRVPPHKHTDSCEARCCCNHDRAHPTSGFAGSLNGTLNGNGDSIVYDHGAECRTCLARVYWRRQGNSIHLEYVYMLKDIPAVQDPNWIRQLDPHSWNITEDAGTKHVYWCPDQGCETNREWRLMYRRMGV